MSAKASKIRLCRECGSELLDGIRVCRNCGTDSGLEIKELFGTFLSPRPISKQITGELTRKGGESQALYADRVAHIDASVQNLIRDIDDKDLEFMFDDCFLVLKHALLNLDRATVTKLSVKASKIGELGEAIEKYLKIRGG